MKQEQPKSGTSVVRPCTCLHEYQDKSYGKDNRVHNVTKKGEHRCTVCGRTH